MSLSLECHCEARRAVAIRNTRCQADLISKNMRPSLRMTTFPHRTSSRLQSIPLGAIIQLDKLEFGEGSIPFGM